MQSSCRRKLPPNLADLRALWPRWFGSPGGQFRTVAVAAVLFDFAHVQSVRSAFSKSTSSKLGSQDLPCVALTGEENSGSYTVWIQILDNSIANGASVFSSNSNEYTTAFTGRCSVRISLYGGSSTLL